MASTNSKPLSAVVRLDVRELQTRALVWDNVWPVDLYGGVSVGNDWGKLDRFAAAGVDVLGVTLAGDDHDAAGALRLVAWARSFLHANADRFVLVERLSDVFAAKAACKLAIILHFEGTGAFGRNLDLVEAFYALGVRQTILAFNNANFVGGGCAEPDGGLTKFGLRMVDELQRVGMLVDLSHVGERTSLDALAQAHVPMVFTHSNAAALHANFRNITDEQIRACAVTGGLVGVSGASTYLGDADCRSETVFRHIDHIAQMVGADHVGIGLDVVYDNHALNAYVRSRPDEWPIARDPSWPGFRYVMPEQIAELIGLLLDHGYRDVDVLNILGGNYARICREVWKREATPETNRAMPVSGQMIGVDDGIQREE